MDYLEGFLIGPVWTDTDYETRRHTAIHIFVSALVGLVYVLMIIFPSYQGILQAIPLPASLIIFIMLMLVTPIIACFYYRMPLYVRPLVLLLYAFKFLLGFWALLQAVLPLYDLEIEGLQEYVFAEVNQSIESAISWFDFAGYLFSMILGIILGGLWLVLRLVIILILIAAIPLAFFILIKLIQYGLDRLVEWFYTKDRQIV
ncbi:MAG: hypothetical protein ACOYEL_03410 [Saccharofermentanales bacterium]|jgi:hypothetical protein